MLNLLLTHWKLAAYGVLAAALFCSGWYVNGRRLNVQIQTIRLEHANALASATQDAKEKQDALAVKISKIDANHTKEITNAYAEIDRLRASGKLRVVATCGDLSRTASGSGVDNATAPRLTDSAQRDYYTLREGIATMTAQLKACQSILKREREK